MNSITFAPIIPTRQQRRDGTYNVKIRITFKRKSRFLSTNLFASPTDLTTRSLKLKQGPLLTRSNALIGEFQQALAGLSPLEIEHMDVDDLVNRIRTTSQKERFVLDFFQWCDKRIPEKSAGARHNYLLAVHAFERFLGKREMDINRITTKLLHDFSVFLDTEIRPNGKTVKKRGGASIRYVKSLGALFRDAQLYYNDEDECRILIPRNPFEKVVYASKSSPSEGQNSLPFELMQRILLDRSRAHVDKATIDECLAHSEILNMADIYVEKDWDVINTANRALLSLFTWP